MSATSSLPTSTDEGRRGRARTPGRPRRVNDEHLAAADSPAGPSRGADGGRGGGRPRRGGRPVGSSDGVPNGTHHGNTDDRAPRNSDSSRPPRRRNRARAAGSDPAQSNSSGTLQANAVPGGGAADTLSTLEPPKRPRRGAKFESTLTESAPGTTTTSSSAKPSKIYHHTAPKADDLTSTLIHSLSTRPYPDCLICFAEIFPGQRTWSCSPSSPIAAVSGELKHDENNTMKGAETAQCCWTTFHLKCIRPWAAKSVKEIEDAWRARGESRSGDWRCPGCQSKRTIVPSGYWCFCGSTSEPKPSSLATPHSCGNPCSRSRICAHPCPLACHPGPCPPCQVTTQLPCHCGKETMSFRCAHLAPDKAGQAAAELLSCGRRCGKTLECGRHTCDTVCHKGPCASCPVKEIAQCYCGKSQRVTGCGEGEERECAVIKGGREARWIGRFGCEKSCDRPFACGVHRCSQPCHPPSLISPPCPHSPSLVASCPCGKHTIDPSSAPFFPKGTSLIRTTCSDPVPTCSSTCMKPLVGCSHACSARCHTGPCPPCRIMLVRPCRCGATTRSVPCAEYQEHTPGSDESEILCDRPCNALRACGRHQCNRICCPLASLANIKGKGKKRAGAADDALVDEAGWHECDLVCGKLLGCGNHHCESRDHRGACPPCLRSSFDEMICQCGRTVLDPPIPCGTRMNCSYPCARPPPPCGHPKAQHACHEDPTPCPPCPFLASKQCACGKKMVDNVRCSLEKVSCGMPCGKLLGCGFHHCERLCHGDACGSCSAVCGKARKLCLPALHPCPHPCHAPASCSETEPCRAIITVSCPCGRIRQPIQCGRSTSNPAGREGSQQIKCSNECLVVKRNARLAEALGINPERAGSREQATYHDDLLSFARANPKFCLMVEKSLSDFFSSEKKSQILPHMPESKRKFVHELAVVYRIDTQMVDQEPNRSVQLLRRIDSRIPSPLLSAALSSQPASAGGASTSNLGKLADLRAPLPQQASRQRISPVPTPPPVAGGSATRGWTSVVSRPQSPQPSPPASAQPVPNARNAGGRPGPPRLVQLTAAKPPEAPPVSPGNVPDNWEDDA